MFSVFTGAGLETGGDHHQRGGQHRIPQSGSTNPKKALGMKINQAILSLLICLSILLITNKMIIFPGFEAAFGCTEETAMRLLEQEDDADDGVGVTAGTEVRVMDTTLQSMASILDPTGTAENLEASQRASDREIELAATEARRASEERAAAAVRAAAAATAAASAASGDNARIEPQNERERATASARMAAEARAATEAAAAAQAAAAQAAAAARAAIAAAATAGQDSRKTQENIETSHSEYGTAGSGSSRRGSGSSYSSTTSSFNNTDCSMPPLYFTTKNKRDNAMKVRVLGGGGGPSC